MMISFLYVYVCCSAIALRFLEIFIVGRCVIVCSMLEDKRYDFLFFFFNFVKNLVVVVLDYERTFEKCVLSYRKNV